ncbi:MAG: hypothetical protein AB1497_03195 [Bacillota bacterium]
MNAREDLRKLVDDLENIKAAIDKSNSIWKYVDLTRRISLILLLSGVAITLFSAVIYALIQRYGEYEAVPAHLRIALYVSVAVVAAAIALGKIKGVMDETRTIHRDMTVIRLVKEIYTPQTLCVLIPYITVIALVAVFLNKGGHTAYVVPALSILFGLFLLAFANIFFMKELLVVGDWLLGTGLLTLFMAGTLHPLIALILTFGLGLPTMYVVNRLWGN